jgi:hypothetical protein
MQLTSGTDLASALSYLEDRGFANKKQNIRLLKRADFNPEIVANFLNAKKALQQSEVKEDSTTPKVLF